MAYAEFGDFEPEFTSYEKSRIVILPVEYDHTSTWIKGSERGPSALLDASKNLEFYDIETDSEVYRQGIHTDHPISGFIRPEEMVQAVYDRVREHMADEKFCVCIGGEHSISIGAMMAHCEKYPEATIVQFDAHADLRNEYHGSEYNHACVMARARELGPVIQIGIRSMDIEEKPNAGFDTFFLAKDIYNNSEWIDRMAGMLSENVYVTFDLDCLDIGIMPSTGTPEPGGLGWYMALDALRTIAQNSNIIGMDISELCPNPVNKAPDFLAAKLLYKMLTYKFEL
jgi:agmatinase